MRWHWGRFNVFVFGFLGGVLNFENKLVPCFAPAFWKMNCVGRNTFVEIVQRKNVISWLWGQLIDKLEDRCYAYKAGIWDDTDIMLIFMLQVFVYTRGKAIPCVKYIRIGFFGRLSWTRIPCYLWICQWFDFILYIVLYSIHFFIIL